MALTPKLEIRQSQSLLMTPQLRQAINLLQLNNLELSELLEQELDNNPFLERENDRLSASDDVPSPSIDDINTDIVSEYDETPFEDEADYDNTFDDSETDREGCNLNDEFSWSDYNHQKSAHPDEDFDYFEKKLAAAPSLHDLLQSQIELNFPRQLDRILALRLSEQLDDAGYFRGNLRDISASLGIKVERLSAVLQTLKTFEPSGIFAENLAECLAIQLRDRNRYDPAIAVLLQHLDLLAAQKFKELKNLCHVDDDDLKSMIADIRALDPKPAAFYHLENPSYIVPDVFVRRAKDGSYQIELNQLSLPRVLLNRAYFSEIKNQTSHNREAKRYLKENLSHANFLIKALHQRATTILRVSEEIVRRQRDFFEYGVEHLKPMSLKDVAYNLELHESTISRTTNRKYMQTPRGLFELKYFFSAAAGTYTGNEETSTLSIKHRIKQLINDETPDKILSDDKLVELLAREGIKIARRTVAKYREAQNIPTSAERKRLKRASL